MYSLDLARPESPYNTKQKKMSPKERAGNHERKELETGNWSKAWEKRNVG